VTGVHWPEASPLGRHELRVRHRVLSQYTTLHYITRPEQQLLGVGLPILLHGTTYLTQVGVRNPADIRGQGPPFWNGAATTS